MCHILPEQHVVEAGEVRRYDCHEAFVKREPPLHDLVHEVGVVVVDVREFFFAEAVPLSAVCSTDRETERVFPIVESPMQIRPVAVARLFVRIETEEHCFPIRASFYGESKPLGHAEFRAIGSLSP